MKTHPRIRVIAIGGELSNLEQLVEQLNARLEADFWDDWAPYDSLQCVLDNGKVMLVQRMVHQR